MSALRGRLPGISPARFVVALGVLVLVATGCGASAGGGSVASGTASTTGATRSATATAFVSATASASATIRPSTGHGGSVATYRGSAARTGEMPGPAPAGTPKIAWTFEAGAPIASSQAVVKGIVYLLGNDGVVHALSLDTGEERWQVSLGMDASASPLVAEGLLIVGDSAGVVHAIAIADGSSRWTTPTDGPISGSAAADGDVVVVATTAGTAYALDVATGTTRWKTALGGSVTTSVAIADGTVYVGASPNLTAIALSDGTIQWTKAVSKEGRIGSPAVVGKLVYAATGIDADDVSTHGVVALDAATGAQHWRYTSPTQATVYTPAVVKGRAYIAGEDHTVTALDAADGRLIWTTPTEQLNEAVAAVADGQVFVAGQGGAMNALDSSTGAIRWSVPYRGTPYGPTVVDGYVLVGTDLGTLMAIGGSAT